MQQFSLPNYSLLSNYIEQRMQNTRNPEPSFAKDKISQNFQRYVFDEGNKQLQSTLREITRDPQTDIPKDMINYTGEEETIQDENREQYDGYSPVKNEVDHAHQYIPKEYIVYNESPTQVAPQISQTPIIIIILIIAVLVILLLFGMNMFLLTRKEREEKHAKNKEKEE